MLCSWYKDEVKDQISVGASRGSAGEGQGQVQVTKSDGRAGLA